MRRLTLALIASGLALATTASAGDTLTLRGRSLGDIQALLFGTSADASLFAGRDSLNLKFEGVKLVMADTPALLALVESTAKRLPPRSEVRLEGTIDRGRFRAGIEKTKTGRIEVKVQGVTLADEGELAALVTSLTRAGVKELKVEGRVNARAVELKLKQDPMKSTVQASARPTI